MPLTSMFLAGLAFGNFVHTGEAKWLAMQAFFTVVALLFVFFDKKDRERPQVH